MLKTIKKTLIILILLSIYLISLNITLAYYNTTSNISNTFHAEKYKFSIDGTGGSFNKENITIDGKEVSLPSPIRDGYDFIGFSSSNSGNVEYTNYIDNVNKINNKEIYAKWDIINYDINYNLNGGTISNQPVSYNIEDSITLPTPTKAGYTFTGWTGTDLSSATKNVTIPKGSIGDRNYTANWNVTNYSISYNLNGGTISNQPTSYNYETTFTLPTPTRKGYTFTGWTGTGLSTATKNVTVSKGNIGNRSYTANWQVTNYSISYNLNGGTITNQPTSYNVENGFTLPTPTKTGYTFTGWTGTGLSSATKNVTVAKGNTGNRSYTANWQAKEYKLNINSIIQNKTYSNGLDGFTCSVWIDGTQVGNKVKDYYNTSVPYGSKVRVYVYDREGYSVKSFRDKTWTVTGDLTINPTWYDDIAPTITSFKVENLGLYNPSAGTTEGWNIRVTINAYDKGTGIQKYQMWIKPYGNGSGSAVHETSSRVFTNVLYLETKNGRTFCATAVDKAGNKSEKSDTIRVEY